MSFPTGKGRGDRYGSAHQAARKQWAAQHDPSHPCSRCHLPLGPMGPHLHLDHDERGGYLGFAHGRCNIVAGARKGASKGARVANARRRRLRQPRSWF